MQEDMKDFVTSQPAAGALFTVVLGELCDFSVATFWRKIETCAEGGGDGGLTAPCGGRGLPSGQHRSRGLSVRRRRGGDRSGEAGTSFALGRRRGACPVPFVFREALPGERL